VGTAARDLDGILAMAGELGDVLPLDILPVADRLELASHMRVRRFRPDEVVFHAGDPAAHVHVVFSGLVKELLDDENGHEMLVRLLARGEFFGELALFEEAPRSTTTVACAPTTTLQLARDGCLRVLDRNPRARDFMFRRLAATIHRLSETVEDLVFLDVPSRLAKYLLALDALGPGRSVTQDDIAAAIGSTRVTVNKSLADLERRGLVRVDRRQVTVLDRTRLGREIKP
jgi:CRP/FNR family cyclic AMP-dependent transcriptional regulator